MVPPEYLHDSYQIADTGTKPYATLGSGVMSPRLSSRPCCSILSLSLQSHTEYSRSTALWSHRIRRRFTLASSSSSRPVIFTFPFGCASSAEVPQIGSRVARTLRALLCFAIRNHGFCNRTNKRYGISCLSERQVELASKGRIRFMTTTRFADTERVKIDP